MCTQQRDRLLYGEVLRKVSGAALPLPWSTALVSSFSQLQSQSTGASGRAKAPPWLEGLEHNYVRPIGSHVLVKQERSDGFDAADTGASGANYGRFSIVLRSTVVLRMAGVPRAYARDRRVHNEMRLDSERARRSQVASLWNPALLRGFYLSSVCRGAP
jgi:hypothetical protein